MSSVKEQNKTELLRLSLTLFAITSIVAVLLAVANYFTSPIISEAAKNRLNHSLSRLMGEATFEQVSGFKDEIKLSGTTIPVLAVYEAKGFNGESMGYCVRTTPQGYSEVIDLMVAIDEDGTVIGTDILSIGDTPGVGMKVDSDRDFRESVLGCFDLIEAVKTAPKNKSQVQVISGATVSSKAYINGVNAAIEVVQLLKQEGE